MKEPLSFLVLGRKAAPFSYHGNVALDSTDGKHRICAIDCAVPVGVQNPTRCSRIVLRTSLGWMESRWRLKLRWKRCGFCRETRGWRNISAAPSRLTFEEARRIVAWTTILLLPILRDGNNSAADAFTW